MECSQVSSSSVVNSYFQIAEKIQVVSHILKDIKASATSLETQVNYFSV